MRDTVNSEFDTVSGNSSILSRISTIRNKSNLRLVFCGQEQHSCHEEGKQNLRERVSNTRKKLMEMPILMKVVEGVSR